MTNRIDVVPSDEEMKKTTLRVAGFEKSSSVDGNGLRYVLFVQGCEQNCEGCHNPGTRNLQGGEVASVYDVYEDVVKNAPFVDGVVFSGGEPLLQADKLALLAKRIKLTRFDKFGKTVDFPIVCYTGYYLSFIEKNLSDFRGVEDLLKEIDFLIDGPFVKELKAIKPGFWAGSSNQRVLSKKMFLKNGRINAI